jgi:hypothetical protein
VGLKRSFGEGELSFTARPGIAIAAGFFVNADVIDPQFDGEDGILVWVAEESAADGDVHD